MFQNSKNIIIFIFISLTLMSCSQSSSPVFQEDVGGLNLVRLYTGTDALKAINKLHGKEIKVAKGMVAFYEGRGEKASVWFSESFTVNEAKNQTDIMIKKMLAGKNSPFRGYKEIDRKDKKIYSFMGMGQEHYIFRIKKDIYWISANSSTIDKIYKSLIN